MIDYSLDSLVNIRNVSTVQAGDSIWLDMGTIQGSRTPNDPASIYRQTKNLSVLQRSGVFLNMINEPVGHELPVKVVKLISVVLPTTEMLMIAK